MKNKFRKNDKLIFHATVLADVIACLYAAIGLAYGIVIIVTGAKIESTETILTGVIIIPIAFTTAFVLWVFIKVTVNMYCDIKLIRNKLYSIDNDYLSALVAGKKNGEETQASSTQQIITGKICNDSLSAQSEQSFEEETHE